jgi:AraC-like DNA-binding protein
LRASGGRHARLTRHEHQLGAWSRARRLPDPRLAGVLDRELFGYHHFRAEFASWLEPPRTQLTLMIDLDGAITADGQLLPDAWIGGLGDTYTLVGLGQAYGSIDLKLHPLGAYRLLGFPLSELTGPVVSLAHVFGAEGSRLAERVRERPIGTTASTCSRSFCWAGWRRRRPAIRWRPAPGSDCARARGRCASRPSPASWAAAAAICTCGSPSRSAWRRNWPRACSASSTSAGRIEVDPPHWAEIAYDAGYADQPHLNRDFRELAGTTPLAFVARQIPGGGVVGDEIPFVQDRAASRA